MNQDLPEDEKLKQLITNALANGNKMCIKPVQFAGFAIFLTWLFIATVMNCDVIKLTIYFFKI